MLTVTLAGHGSGMVSSAPAGITCGNDCAAVYDLGTVVTLTAAANADSVFSGWSGGDCDGAGTCEVTMDRARAVTARFNVGAP